MLSDDGLEDWIFALLMDRTRDAWRIAPILAKELREESLFGECPFCGDDQDV